MQGELLQGTLDLLILKTIAAGPAHGHTIAHLIARESEEVLFVEHGSLYPDLHRLDWRAWVVAYWGVSENNRRARFYRHTAKGRRQLHQQQSRWAQLARAINRIVQSEI